ncbi:nucleotidyltransferase [Gordonia malaquae]|uniref:nucleotidyltransferase n=1 Tax=Gordonia malaquae TaxID=410332 RepID=UPI00301AAF31
MPKAVAVPGSLALREAIEAHRGEFRALLEKYGATSPKLFDVGTSDAGCCGAEAGVLVEMFARDGNLLMRASGLMEEVRVLVGRDDVAVFPVQLLRGEVRESVVDRAVDCVGLPATERH